MTRHQALGSTGFSAVVSLENLGIGSDIHAPDNNKPIMNNGYVITRQIILISALISYIYEEK